jgi:hypothetical protein
LERTTLKAEFGNGSQFLPYDITLDVFAGDGMSLMGVFLTEFDREVKRWKSPLLFLE